MQNPKEDITQKNLQKLEQLEKASKPLWITRQFVDRPFVVILICSIFFIICTILTITESWLSQSKSEDREWLQWGDEKVQENDQWEEAQEQFKELSVDKEVPLRNDEIQKWTTTIMLECWKDCSNVLTPDGVNLLREVEQEIKNLKNYNIFCLSTPDINTCSSDAVSSFINSFTQNELESGITQAELDSKLDFVLQEANFSDYSYLFGKSFTSQNKKTKYLASIFKFGAPIEIDGKRYKDRFDNFKKQEEYFKDFSEEIIKIADKYHKKAKGGINLIVGSGIIADIKLGEVINKDFLWALASIVFVWGYMTFHIQSFFLSSFAMFNIIMSFPLTLFIFRLILRVTYFSTLHILVVFIVLGIAADDVFVFIDAWNQSKHQESIKDDLQKRMAVTYRRASKAMLATSSTTAAAFLATGLSTIMPISSFGIFAGILIPMNYILVITFFPAILIVQERYFKQCCCRRKVQNKIDKTENKNAQQEQGIRVDIPDIYKESNDQANKKEYEGNEQNEKQTNIKQKTQSASKIELFFENIYTKYLFKTRYIVIIVIAIWTGLSIWRSTLLGPLSEQEKWLPDSYDLQRMFNHLANDMHTSGKGGERIKIDMYWGIKGIDVSDAGKWDASDKGKIQWDNDFDLGEPQNQQYLYDVCQNMKVNENVLDQDVSCFIDKFKEFVEKSNAAFPVPSAQFMTTLDNYIKDDLGKPFFLDSKIGLFKNRLHYVAFEMTAKGNPNDPYEKQETRNEQWEKIESNIRKNAPAGLKKMFQSSAVWAWMVSQKAFVTNAIQGMFVSLAFAFLVLILSTQNIIISIYSILSIAGIVTSVVAVMQLNGWELGVAESITVVILIGFSVDYVVHLANHYVECSYPDRYSKTQESLKEIGISIISGSITTLGAGIFLFFAVVSIFNKFAVLIVATISFSLLYSLGLFSALLLVCGPQKDFGNLLSLCKKKQCKRVASVDKEQPNQVNKEESV